MRKCNITYEQRAEHIKCLFRTYASRYAYESAKAYIFGVLRNGYIDHSTYSKLSALALAEYRRKSA